jgi:predicted O-linked N-acetylglucosamine transferase (SPINDLY family)
LDKDLKIKDPEIRAQQDIAYNEALIIDIQKDIDKLEQKKKEIELTLEIYQNISKKIKMKNKDIRTIQQLMYNISKVKNMELKKKLMNMLRTYKMKEFVDDTILVKRTNIILSRIRNGTYDDDLENGKKMAMRYINQIKSKPLQRKKIRDMEDEIEGRK